MCQPVCPSLGGVASLASILFIAAYGSKIHKSTDSVRATAFMAFHSTNAPKGPRKTAPARFLVSSCAHHYSNAFGTAHIHPASRGSATTGGSIKVYSDTGSNSTLTPDWFVTDNAVP